MQLENNLCINITFELFNIFLTKAINMYVYAQDDQEELTEYKKQDQ